MPKKAYLVQIEIEYVAIAENEQEAIEFAREAIEDIATVEDYCYAKPLTRYPIGWDDDNILVYHNGDEDITIKEAFQKFSPEIKEQENILIQKIQEARNTQDAKNTP